MNSTSPVPNYQVPHIPPSPDSEIKGVLSIFLRTTGKVGTDTNYRFGETIKIENGEKFLSVKPHDLIYFLRLVTKKPNGENNYQTLELPSSLFEQARYEDRVRFSKEGKNYDLELGSFQRYTSRGYKPVSFDACVETVKENFKDSPVEFMYEWDIPDDYCHLTRQGVLSHDLSPQTKRVVLGQPGTVPVNLDDLESFSSCATEPRVLYEGSIENHHVILLQACGLPKIETFLDRNHLYVHIENRPENHWAGEHLFFHRVFHSDKIIDEATISTSLDNTGVLTIDIPFLGVRAVTAPVVPSKTQILVRYDAGHGNTLYIRGQGHPSLSWNQGVKMKNVEPDLWALELKTADFQNLKYKVLLNDLIWEQGDNHEIEQGKSLEAYPKF